MAKELLKDLIYGEQLVSAGCKVDFAVGLTYSLDLEAMLIVPLAFGDLGELDSDVRLNPAFLLEGIRRSSDKIALFCNKGCINIPCEARTIYSLMESSIFEVQNKNDSRDDIFSNFHPKIWLVKETDKDGAEYLKLVVMSRNLTFSSNLDICCTLRGRIGSHRSEKGANKHKPLKEMILWVSKFADKAKAKEVCLLAECLDRVDRFELEDPFQTEDAERNEEEGYDFFPFVFKEEMFDQYRNEIKSRLTSADRIMVMSPFIDINTLEWLTKNKKKGTNDRMGAILVTKTEFVTREAFDLFDEVWVPNDAMLDNSTDTQIDLHAKMYLTYKQAGKGCRTGYDLYLGSANATRNAYSRNTEFLLHLRYKHTTKDRIKELMEDITGERRFIKMDTPNFETTSERPDNSKERALKKSMGCLKKAEVSPSATDGLYDITLTIEGKYDSNISIIPLQCYNGDAKSAMWQQLGRTVEFKGLPPSMLSEFYILRIQTDDGSYLKRITKVRTTGMPANRDESIYQSVVTRKEELLDYVALMLSDRPAEFLFEQQANGANSKRTNSTNSRGTTMPIYERLLKAAVNNPKQIKEILDFVGKMKQDIVPEELRNLLDTFRKASKQL